MNRPLPPPDSRHLTPDPCPLTPGHRPAYTLVEILTATVLMLVIMMAVTIVFAAVTDSIAESRATLEMTQRLRATAATLKQDLANVTAPMAPPLHPRQGKGYFQYVEGPIGPVIDPAAVAWNSELSLPDTTVGDIDDILMFTAKSDGEPYVGLIAGAPATSNCAEIIWFIRGTTLYRRVLLVRPDISDPNWRESSPPNWRLREVPREGFYARYDLSVRKEWDGRSVPFSAAVTHNRPVLVANSLADLTRPNARFAHNPDPRGFSATRATSTGLITGPKIARNDPNLRYVREEKPFPHFLRPWLGSPCDSAAGALVDRPLNTFRWAPGLGLPVLAECSDPTWVAGDFIPTENPSTGTGSHSLLLQMPRFPSTIAPVEPFDAWTNPHPWAYIANTSPYTINTTTPAVDPITGVTTAFPNGTRLGEDVIMTNVIGFDVKAWDPGAPVLNHVVENPVGTVIDQVVVAPGDPGYIQTLNRLIARMADGSVGASGIAAVTGAYVDLNYMARVDPNFGTGYYPHVPGLDRYFNTLPVPTFYSLGNYRSLAYGTQNRFAYFQEPYDYFPAVYDTWSLHYEYNRQTINYVDEDPTSNNRADVTVGNEDGDGLYDEGTNSLDDDSQNGVDDLGERETAPPYRVPLEGIQVSIRVFEPGSRQIREVTIIQKFKTQ